MCYKVPRVCEHTWPVIRSWTIKPMIAICTIIQHMATTGQDFIFFLAHHLRSLSFATIAIIIIALTIANRPLLSSRVWYPAQPSSLCLNHWISPTLLPATKPLAPDSFFCSHSSTLMKRKIWKLHQTREAKEVLKSEWLVDMTRCPRECLPLSRKHYAWVMSVTTRNYP